MALTLKGLRKAAHAAGAGATHVFRTAVYGTRRLPDEVGAGRPIPSSPAIGKMIHSVFDTPAHRRGGAPIVKRARSA